MTGGDAAVGSLVREALDGLNDMLSADGARLVVVAAEPGAVDLELDLSESDCVECVLPHDLMLRIVRARLAEADPDLTEVRLADPRQG
jgi:hypothetical protein